MLIVVQSQTMLQREIVLLKMLLCDQYVDQSVKWMEPNEERNWNWQQPSGSYS